MFTATPFLRGLFSFIFLLLYAQYQLVLCWMDKYHIP